MTEPNLKAGLPAIRQLHQLYCQATGQNLILRFDRERLWYEFLQAGFNAADLQRVLTYLQKEIRATRRNLGALKLSNLLQLDRFEEDLNISRVRLRTPVTRCSNAIESSINSETFAAISTTAPPLLNHPTVPPNIIKIGRF